MIGHQLKLHRNLLSAFIFCLASLGFGHAAHADSSSVRAARLTYLQGTVTINPPDNSGAVPAQLNLPLLSGVQLATGADGQAEVEFEDGSVARITPNSALSLDNLALDPNGVFTTSLSLLRGLAYFELRATPQYLYSINAGGDVLSPVENTTVRVNFDEPPAIFAVLDGTVQIGRQNSPNGADGYQTSVRAGESLRADPGDASRYFLTQEIDQDSWDQWNEDQDQTAAAQSSGSTTSVRNNYEGAQGYGWSDLDADGSWYNVPGQGPVWQPDVAVSDASFDPYGDGAWVEYSGVGYVWASAYPWGWTPYRCGSWSYFNSFGWGWAPGETCGGLGWGFVGGGRPVNVVIGPSGYHPIRVPTPGHGPWRPLLPVRATNGPPPAQRVPPVQRGPRQIAGTTVTPIRPVGGAVTITNGSAVGSSLRRDFPVNSSTKAPVMGTASTAPAAIHTYRPSGGRVAGSQPPTAVVGPVTNQPPAVSYPANNGSPRRGTAQPAGPTAPPNSGQFHPVPAQPSNPPAPANNGQFQPAPTARPQQPAPEAQRPAQQYAPVQRAEPQRSSPPPPSRSTYSPPPSPPPSHPASSPPPASSSQGRSSPK